MRDLRTQDCKARYLAKIEAGDLRNGCALCRKESLEEFSNWRIVDNSFPYDRISDLHHMLIPVSHCTESELGEIETQELLSLKKGVLNDKYDFILEGLPHTKSIPEHFHLHLLVTKDFED